MPELKEDGFAMIREGYEITSLNWRPGKVVEVVEFTGGDKTGKVRVRDGCDRQAFIYPADLEPIELPEVRDSLFKAHRYLTRTRSKLGWTIQVVWGDLPDEVMAQEVAEMLKGYADMVAELERLRTENHELRRSNWALSPEAQDDLVRRLG